MRTAYFDCFSGACGNMILGALVDAGLSIKKLKAELKKLKLSGYDITARKISKNGISCTYLDVKIKPVRAIHELPLHKHHPHRNLRDITRLITRSKLSRSVKERSVAVFTRLAKAEAKVHGTSIYKIHFHEVGAVDAIVDIVGSVVGLELLKIEKVYCSPLPLSRGFVDCSHGRLPVPAPATMELLKGIPLYKIDVDKELVTPTGAAILTSLADSFGNMPDMMVSKIGYGAGKAELEHPNTLRMMIGETSDTKAADKVISVETNIDDMNPQIYNYLFERLFAAGALDAYISHIQMKKNRPGILLTVISSKKDLQKVLDILFRETTTIGVRMREYDRKCLERKVFSIKTKYGNLKAKASFLNNQAVNIQPEYEDCRLAAIKNKVPLKIVMKEAIKNA